MSIRSMETLDRIREFITLPAEVLNKSQLFDENVLEVVGRLGDKVINVLVSFNVKMKQLLVQMREVIGEVSPLPQPETKAEPEKLKETTPFKTPLSKAKQSPSTTGGKAGKSLGGVDLTTPTKEPIWLESGIERDSTPRSVTQSRSQA